MHALYVLVPILCILVVAYRYYSAFITARLLVLDDTRPTPAHTQYDGHNYYPNDIEFTVQQCDPVLVSGRGAAFAVDGPAGGIEQLVIVHEVDSTRIAETVMQIAAKSGP